MKGRSDDRVLRLSRFIAASPEKLFDAWTRPETLLKWWGPEGAKVARYEFDIRRGGRWSTELANSMGGSYTCSGVYWHIDRPRRLVFTWAWLQPDGSRGHETLVEVTFDRTEKGTFMTIVQSTFEDREQRNRHIQGWTSTLDKLERLLA
jgi:uncharacterized protein YndB with AHSA1/START domain